MRINRETLLKNAQDTVTQRSRTDRGIIAAYLCGSLLGDDYMLGGSADIDLVFIHLDRVPDEREIVRLTDDVHLDIAHHYHKDYQQTRTLRLHPWLGPTLCDCKALYDPQHFLDFTQASVRGQFYRSDRVLARAKKGMDHARQIWVSFSENTPEPRPEEIALYLRAVEHAANAVARLNGPPLTDRRFLMDFPKRAEEAKRPGLYPGLLGLLGAPQVDRDTIKAWIPGWTSAFEAVSRETGTAIPARLDLHRLDYYRKAILALLESGQPQASLWPLLRTWTDAVRLLPADSEHFQAWRNAGLKLGLVGQAFAERVSALDAFLDLIEETLENWARENGAFL